MPEEKTVAIPAATYEACARTIEGTNFESVDEYVAFVLSEVLEPTDDHDDGRYPDVPEDQLRSLGYLDG